MTVVQSKGNHRFVSGAEEKVARVFEAPLSFLKTLNNASFQKSCSFDDVQSDVQILGANMSALGLSQRPIYVQGLFFIFLFFHASQDMMHMLIISAASLVFWYSIWFYAVVNLGNKGLWLELTIIERKLEQVRVTDKGYKWM